MNQLITKNCPFNKLVSSCTNFCNSHADYTILMKAVFTHQSFQASLPIIISIGLLVGSQGCFSDVDTYTPVQVLVQDSTGKPLPGFRLLVLGSTDGTFGSKTAATVDSYTITTDTTGSVQTNLHWHNKISFYAFTRTDNPTYAHEQGAAPYLPPLNINGQLEYTKVSSQSTTLIRIPVILR